MEHLRLDLAAGPWWLYVIMSIVAAVFAAAMYARTNPPLDGRSRWLLVALRSIGLLCLILMLFEPLARYIRSEEQRPRIAIALDVSRSMTIRDGSGDRAGAARAAAGDLVAALGGDADVVVFDESVRSRSRESVDSIQFRGFRTDLAGAVRWVANADDGGGYGAMVLISDGNHNGEEQPLQIAERSGLGVYSVGIGDTVAPRDVRALGLLVTGIAVVREPLPVTFDLTHTNVPDGEVEVTFADNGVVFATERVAIRRTAPRASITVTWSPSADGIRKLTAKVRPLAGEFTDRNNELSEFVRVRRNKRRIVLVAGAPSPDLTFLRSSMTTDPSVSVQTYVQKQGGDFYEGAIPATAFDDVEAIVLVGFPTAASQRSVVERIGAAAANGRALLFVASQQVDYSKLSALDKVLPFRVSGSRPQEFMVTPNVGRGATADPIIKIDGTDADRDAWNTLPPIYRTETFVDLQPGAVVLSTVKVGTAELDEPLIMKRESGNARSVAILGYGLYRWKLLGEGPALARGGTPKDVLGRFMNNTMAWLSVRDDQRRVRIRSTHPFYAAGENVVFQASVQDGSFSPVDGAEVRVTVNGPSGRREFVLTGQGGGRYALDASAMPPGDYAYTGTAVARGVALGTDAGRFSVGDLGLEEGASTQNRSLLSMLASRTGGVVFGPENVDSLVQALKADPRLRSQVRTSEREAPLYHLPWLIALAVLAFSLEWFLRKRRGLV